MVDAGTRPIGPGSKPRPKGAAPAASYLGEEVLRPALMLVTSASLTRSARLAHQPFHRCSMKPSTESPARALSFPIRTSRGFTDITLRSSSMAWIAGV